MQCTAEEIEAKKKLALQKLAARRKVNQPSPLSLGPNGALRTESSTPNGTAIRSPRPQGVFKGAQKSFLPGGTATGSFQSRYSPYKKQSIEANKPALTFHGKSAPIVAKLALIASNRFSVDINAFSSLAVDVMKTVPSRFYDPKTKIWNFHIDDYELLLNKMSMSCPDITIEKLPNYVLNCCRQTSEMNSSLDLNRIDSELLGTLLPFQEEGVCFGINKNGRCLIADDMGLGKTFQALAIADYYRTDWPLLIVTTATMKSVVVKLWQFWLTFDEPALPIRFYRENRDMRMRELMAKCAALYRNVWEDTIQRYMPSVPVMTVQYMVSGKDYIGGSQVLIVSHDLMSRCSETLLDRGFGVVIIDESHVLKNYKAKCTKAATALAKRARRVVLLSGTPALSRPSELYTQMSILDERFFVSFFEYSSRYCDGKQTNFGWDSSGQSNLQELEILLAKKFMIRRTKDMLKSLPDKIQEVVKLDVDLGQFSDEDKKCLFALAAKYNSEKKDRHALLLTFFAETAKIKIPSVCSYVLQTLESGKKFLVFAHHQVMLNAVEQVLQRKRKKYIRIDGSTTCDQRKYFVDKFQADDSYVCAVLSITAANAGITLTAAQLVLFAELHWNPSILSQAEARAHRIGQYEQVTIQYLIAPGTADDSIWPLLENKQKTLQEIGLTRDSFDAVSIRQQTKRPLEDVAGCLDSTVTSANTLDIKTYFTSSTPTTKAKSDVHDLLDDDFDDIFSNVNIDMCL